MRKNGDSRVSWRNGQNYMWRKVTTCSQKLTKSGRLHKQCHLQEMQQGGSKSCVWQWVQRHDTRHGTMGAEARSTWVLRYETELSHQDSVRQKTSWNTVGILWQDSRMWVNSDIKSCTSLRHAKFSRQDSCTFRSSGTAGRVVPPLRQFGVLGPTGPCDHEDEATTIARIVRTAHATKLRHIAHHRNPHHLALYLFPLFYLDWRRCPSLKQQLTLSSFCTCMCVRTCNKIITRLQMVHSVT
jgi:hypothetical protein